MFKCKCCEELRKQNTYLQSLVDNLLMNKGIKAVNILDDTPLPESEEEKEDRALKEKGAIRYGD